MEGQPISLHLIDQSDELVSRGIADVTNIAALPEAVPPVLPQITDGGVGGGAGRVHRVDAGRVLVMLDSDQAAHNIEVNALHRVAAGGIANLGDTVDSGEC